MFLLCPPVYKLFISYSGAHVQPANKLIVSLNPSTGSKMLFLLLQIVILSSFCALTASKNTSAWDNGNNCLQKFHSANQKLVFECMFNGAEQSRKYYENPESAPGSLIGSDFAEMPKFSAEGLPADCGYSPVQHEDPDMQSLSGRIVGGKDSALGENLSKFMLRGLYIL